MPGISQDEMGGNADREFDEMAAKAADRSPIGQEQTRHEYTQEWCFRERHSRRASSFRKRMGSTTSNKPTHYLII